MEMVRNRSKTHNSQTGLITGNFLIEIKWKRSEQVKEFLANVGK
jgi:hypothetical protein